MDASSGQNQEMSSDSVGNMLVVGPKAGGSQAQNPQERKPRPHPEQALKCPRCDSSNTKFCYYNNYSLTQPRYFCKACRRYWTKGGTLRNVPVGGGCRKNRRSSSSSSSSTSSSSSSKHHRGGPQDLHNPLMHPAALMGPGPGFPLPPLLGGAGTAGCYDQNDLTLAFARLQKSSCNGGAEQLGFDHLSILGNIPSSTGHDMLGLNNHPSAASSGFLEALRSGFLESAQNSSTAASATSAFQNLYYGFCNNNNNNSENSTPTTVGVSGGSDHHNGNMGLVYDHDHDHDHDDQMSNATTTAVTVTTIKQELGHGNGHASAGHHGVRDYDHHDQHDHQSNRMLWGCPWQINGSDHHGIGSGNMSDFDGSATGRESWNGLASSWHGLLNTTPLM